MEQRRVVELTDPRALRAVAHPIRLALLGLLRREGPMTATQAGARIDESPSSCSFHFRQLAKYGLVEDAGGGQGRQRPWRATALSTSWPDTSDDPELAAAGQLLTAVVAERIFELFRQWLARRPAESREWQDAIPFGDAVVWLTADELAGVARAHTELLERYVERTTRPELRPPGARRVTVLQIAHPAESPPTV